MSEPSQRVAIVGIGGVFPGAIDPDAFWNVARAGRDATSDVPPGRWLLDPSAAFDSGLAVADRVFSLRGGFLPEFQPDLRGLAIDPALVAELDPVFQLALHCGASAWRDARLERVDLGRVGVVLGNIVLPTETMSTLTREVLGRAFASSVLGRPVESHEHPTHPLNRHVAGLPAALLAHALGLGGGTFTLDAACASSLYALKLAVDELLSGRADAMITGGLSRPDALYTQMGFSQLRALSPTGKARPFDARGDGLVVGEGAGMFVLERLDDAIRHGHHVYGVVAGVGLSNDVDGGLLAPSTEGQLRAMRSAYAQAGWDPAEVDLIECHATGTPVGDAVEVASLRALWTDASGTPGRCVIGSHKANFGHALTASGAAGLLKLLLALRHRSIPPTANFAGPAAKLGLEQSPFRITTQLEPWPDPPPGRGRRAAISGFGFGGINAHALIEEHVKESSPSIRAFIPFTANAEPIAIVGIGARFGSGADLDAFLGQVIGGGQPESTHCSGLELPPDRFRIPPRELEEMLPQQTLALLAAADALSEAGWSVEASRLSAGVFVGIALDPNTANFHLRWWMERALGPWSQELGFDPNHPDQARWAAALRDAAAPPLTANRTMGSLGGLIASRIAREYRLGGPSFSVSCEETSGLRALEIGVRALRAGELDAAVVGAVDLTVDPRLEATAARAGLESVRHGDGAAALVLERLSDAQRNGRRIHAVIRDISSHGGPVEALRSAGTESHRGQMAAHAELLDRAGSAWGVRVSATPTEHARAPVPTSAFLGDTGAAAGLATLVRAVGCLSRRVLPVSIATNSGETTRVAPRPWLRDRQDGPRRALVEFVGLGGNHVRVELEEGESSSTVEPSPGAPLGPALLTLTGDEPAGLERELEALEEAWRTAAESNIHDLARRWWKSRRGVASRRLGVSLVARDEGTLREALAEARDRLAGSRPRQAGRGFSVHFSADPLARHGDCAFVFPGIGNHFPDMGRALGLRWPGVFEGLDRQTRRLRAQLLPGSAWEGRPAGPFEDHRAPILAQVVLGTAITDLLARFGVAPHAVIGYSLGESSALFATRAWTERDAMHARLDASPLFRTELCGPCDAARRAWRLTPTEPVDWLAGIVPAAPASIRDALVGIPRAYLMIINTPGECVVGGQAGDVRRLLDRLGLTSRFLPLPVVSTVHCPVAREVETAYCELHRLATTPRPRIRYYSTASATPYTPDRESAAEAIVAQAMDTVDFPAVIRRAHDDGIRLFVEVGPGASCARMISATLADRPHGAFAICPATDDPMAALVDALARLHAEGVPLDLDPLFTPDSRPPSVGSIQTNATTTRRPPLRIPVGVAPIDPPPTPTRREPGRPATVATAADPQPSRAAPTTPRPTPGDTTTMPAFEPESPVVPFERVPDPQSPVWIDETITDSLLAQAVATESARARAHREFLSASQGVAQAIAEQLARHQDLVHAWMDRGALEPASSPRTPVDPPPVASEPEALTDEAPPFPRRALDRAACLEFAVGMIGRVFGETYAAADAYPTRVRLPDEPLMLVDRVTRIEGEPLSMTSGRIVTEHDVLPGAWYLDQGRAPACISIESGQADLMLSGWLGIDLVTRGLAVYRLLDAAVTFHRALPRPGEVARYDIRILGFFRQGDTHLFRFEFDGSIDGQPLLTMRDGCAGFFSAAELAAGQGIVRRGLDMRAIPGKRPDDWRDLAPMRVESYDDAQVEALRRGDLAAAFGASFAGLALESPARLPGGRMALVHRVPVLDPTGGRFGLGLIRTELDIHPGDWFLTCHFVDDQVMPGTLMYECCLHALRIYLTRLGWVAEEGKVAFEPALGVSSRLRCRGQVVETTRSALFEVVIKEIGYGPEPFAIADAMMYADGKAIVEVNDMTLRLSGVTRADVERLWIGRSDPEPAGPCVFTREQVLAFATGRPSDAFGARYAPFDHDRFIARLPAPPYSFLDRVESTTVEPFVMASGGEAVGVHDAPARAWYFDAERRAVMPFAVLQEVALQACGWTSARMGSALASEEDLHFRNLGGEATVLAEVTPGMGPLRTRVRVTRVAHSAGMILQHYDFETRAGDQPVYRGTTYFGFFRAEALADQVGIREAKLHEPTSAELGRALEFAYPTPAPFPDTMLRMLDRVDCLVPDGGPAGLGFARASLAVRSDAWFFGAHFHGDPVCPGSLGLESLLQLLKVIAYHRWAQGRIDALAVGFESIALGQPHRWQYRGQVVPSNRIVTVQAVVTAVDERRRLVVADGWLSVDGRVIYQMNGFSVRLLAPE